MRMIKIVEKNNKLAVHGIFDRVEEAEYHLTYRIPEYVQKGFFMDKTLTPSDFEILMPDS